MAATNVQAFSGDVEISSNLAVDTNKLFVDSVGGTVGIGSTLIDITDPTLSGAGNGLYIHNPVEGGHLLTLGTQRPWVFEQGLSDASTRLCLRSLNSSKMFSIQSPDYSNVMTVVATDGGGAVGIGTDSPPSTLTVVSTIDALDASDSATFDKYTAVISNTMASDADDKEMGISFASFTGTTFPSDARTPGAAITHERVDSWSKGKLHFKTKGNTNYNGACTTRMTIDESGNVGIGTASPTGFEVYNKPINQKYRNDFTNIHVNNKYQIDSRDSAAPNTLSQRYGVRAADNEGSNPEIGELIIGAHADQNYPSAKGSFLSFNDSGQFYIATHPTANYGEDVTLGSNETYPHIGTVAENQISPLFTVRSSGNVGIGTTSPQQKMHLHQDDGGQVVFAITNTDTGSTENSGLHVGIDSSENGFLFHKPNKALLFATNNTERMRISGTGNVGIGTNDPGHRLHVYGSANQLVEIQNTSDTSRIVLNGAADTGGDLIFQQNGTSTWGIASIGDNLHILGDDSTSQYRMSFLNGGQVGIGRSDPSFTLDVSGNFRVGGGSYLDSMYFDVFGESANKVVLFRDSDDDDTVYFRFRNQQSVLQREIGGHIQGYLQEYSDDRLKVNERYLTDGLDVIKRLKPQVYDKRPDLVENLERDGYNVESIEKKEVGFIAQDIYYEVPELKHIVDVGGGVVPAEHITIGDDPTEDPDYSSWGNVAAGIRYTEIIPYNTAAIQDLSNLRDLDVDRITVLESQVSNLLARVQTLESGTP